MTSLYSYSTISCFIFYALHLYYISCYAITTFHLIFDIQCYIIVYFYIISLLYLYTNRNTMYHYLFISYIIPCAASTPEIPSWAQ